MKRIKTLLVVMVLFGLSCNFVTRAVFPATPTAAETVTAIASPISLATPTPLALLTETSAGAGPSGFIPKGCLGQPVATLSPEEAVIPPTPQLEPNPEISTDDQLIVLRDLSHVVEQVYLYPDFNGVDFQGLVDALRKKIKAGLNTEDFYHEMIKLVDGLGDEHSQFQSPSMVEQSDAELEGKNDYVGIGVLVEPMIEKGRLSIIAVFPDSPAENSGLQPHDSILAVDGRPVVEDGQELIWRVRGPQCSAAVFTVQTPGEEPRQVMIMRYKISSSVKVDARLVKTTDGSRIGYIFLPSFYDNTLPGQVRQALESFGDLDGLIIDNRQNTGGSSTVVEPILSYFTSGKLGSFVSASNKEDIVVSADPVHNSQKVPLVILVGEGSVSYGEIFSGMLQDTGRAKIAGKTTLGNVEVLLSHYFDDGSRVWLAEERFKPLHTQADWEKQGIVPDLEAYADWDTFTFESDPGIAGALTLLGHK